MLKLTYTENGLHMERVMAPLEVLIAQRIVLAMRLGQHLYIQPGRASFLLPATAPSLKQLEQILRLEQTQVVMVTPVDQEFVEATVYGSWIAENIQAETGIFVTAVSDMAEFLLLRLWEAQTQVSFLA
ncbi:hypothetical protein JOY44_19090 [Phormidium sp. CLA17]|uniref:alr0857 family protein n=1 Tax=Leptolyngbya sp. Cla-17 TaxID=2803751 RepID=UPI00149319A7|nr:alr0857 family protein [Leptolyngbya sp. Cla-17]MBM0743695.1 hypothetical protein [Leptolyngbya sp. Cla-17]